MSDRSEAIGLASASSACPPPNNSAAGFEMNDHVTASTMPRAASARLARRVRSWIAVSTGLRGASPRSNGVIGTLSTPTMRTISSTMSALPCTSVRQEGTATFTTGPLPATMKPRWLEDAPHLRQRHLDAGEALDLGQREIDHAIFAEGACRRRRSPTACRRTSPCTSLVASSSPGTMKAGSTPRSKR